MSVRLGGRKGRIAAQLCAHSGGPYQLCAHSGALICKVLALEPWKETRKHQLPPRCARRPGQEPSSWIGSPAALSLKSGRPWPVGGCLLKFFGCWAMPLATRSPWSATTKALKWAACPQAQCL